MWGDTRGGCYLHPPHSTYQAQQGVRSTVVLTYPPWWRAEHSLVVLACGAWPVQCNPWCVVWCVVQPSLSTCYPLSRVLRAYVYAYACNA